MSEPISKPSMVHAARLQRLRGRDAGRSRADDADRELRVLAHRGSGSARRNAATTSSTPASAPKPSASARSEVKTRGQPSMIRCTRASGCQATSASAPARHRATACTICAGVTVRPGRLSARPRGSAVGRERGETHEALDHLVDRDHGHRAVRRHAAGRRLPAQRLADERRDLVGDAAARRSGMGQHDRQAQRAAVDEAVTAVVGEQLLGDHLVCAVRGRRRLEHVVADDIRQLAAEGRDRAREQQHGCALLRSLLRSLLRTATFQQRDQREHVGLESLAEVALRLERQRRREMEDSVGRLREQLRRALRHRAGRRAARRFGTAPAAACAARGDRTARARRWRARRVAQSLPGALPAARRESRRRRGRGHASR